MAGLPVLARNRNLHATIYMTRLTAPAIDWGEAPRRALGDISGRRRLSASATSKCRASASRTTRAIPVGFRFEAQGVRIGVVTDLGYIPESVKFHLRRTDLLLLEANHDLDMLKVGPYPWAVKQRVMSRVGHLSNLVMSDYLLERSGLLHRRTWCWAI